MRDAGTLDSPSNAAVLLRATLTSLRKELDHTNARRAFNLTINTRSSAATTVSQRDESLSPPPRDSLLSSGKAALIECDFVLSENDGGDDAAVSPELNCIPHL